MEDNGTATCKLKRWENTINLVRIAFLRVPSREIQTNQKTHCAPILSIKRPRSGSTFIWTRVFALIKGRQWKKFNRGDRVCLSRTQRTTFNFYARSPSNNRENHSLFGTLFVRTHARTIQSIVEPIFTNFHVIQFIEIVWAKSILVEIERKCEWYFFFIAP